LRDDQWERIKDLPPGRAGTVDRPARDNRRFVEAVLYRYRAGLPWRDLPWRDLPKRFGPWEAVHTRHSRWAARGVWAGVFEALAQEADNEYAILDATVVRAHQHSAGARRAGATRQTSGKPSRSASPEGA